MAAARVGPKTRRPRCPKCIHNAQRQRQFRPDDGQVRLLGLDHRDHRIQVARSAGTQRAICAMPPLPGAQTTSVTRSLFLTAHASACSRPPDPRIKTFIVIASCGSGLCRNSQAGLWSAIGRWKSNRHRHRLVTSRSPILAHVAGESCTVWPMSHGRTPHQTAPAQTPKIPGAPNSGASTAQPGLRTADRGRGHSWPGGSSTPIPGGSFPPAGGARESFATSPSAGISAIRLARTDPGPHRQRQDGAFPGAGGTLRRRNRQLRFGRGVSRHGPGYGQALAGGTGARSASPD